MHFHVSSFGSPGRRGCTKLSLMFRPAARYAEGPLRFANFFIERSRSMYYQWAPYVPVGQRIAKAIKFAARRAKKEKREPAPVKAKGRELVSKFWGQAWCDNLDRYSDFANRLPRGRTYLGNGSLVDLQVKPGRIEAIVAGSEVYEVAINIKPLPAKLWKALQRDCGRSIHSLLDLLQGKFDDGVMQRIARSEGGLFPRPSEIDMDCSCPDGAYVCKHIAAVIYGVGVRLDTSPELLFTLRKVDHLELVAKAASKESLEASLATDSSSLAAGDLGDIFGIELSTAATSGETPKGNGASPTTKSRKRMVRPPGPKAIAAARAGIANAHGAKRTAVARGGKKQSARGRKATRRKLAAPSA
jgi:uncharacterized Zn finger protein